MRHPSVADGRMVRSTNVRRVIIVESPPPGEDGDGAHG